MSTTLEDKNMRVTGCPIGSSTATETNCPDGTTESTHRTISDECQESYTSSDQRKGLKCDNSSVNREMHSNVTPELVFGKSLSNQIIAENSSSCFLNASDCSLKTPKNEILSQDQNDKVKIICYEAVDLKIKMESGKFENENLPSSNVGQNVAVTINPHPLSSGCLYTSTATYEEGQVWKKNDDEGQIHEKNRVGDTKNVESVQKNKDERLEVVDEEDTDCCETSKPSAWGSSTSLRKGMSSIHKSRTFPEKDFVADEAHSQNNSAVGDTGSLPGLRRSRRSRKTSSKLNYYETESSSDLDLIEDEIQGKAAQSKNRGDYADYVDVEGSKIKDLKTVNEEIAKPFACPHCAYRGKCWAYLKKHISRTHKNKDFSCDDCGAVFRNIHQLVSHLEVHSDKIPFECLVCKCNFKNVEALNQHMMTHTSLKQISCNFCDYVCKNQKQLEIHTESHKYRGLFQCKDCEFICKTQENFQQHLKKHKMKGTRCSQPKVEKQQQMLTQANQKVFSCEHCDFHCETKPELTSHLLIHTEVNRFVCSLCDFSCRSKTLLIKHTITHMNDEEDDDVDPDNSMTLVKDASPNTHYNPALGKNKSLPHLNSIGNRRTPKEPETCEIESFRCMKVVEKPEAVTAKQRVENSIEKDGKYIMYVKSEEKSSSSGFDPIEEALIEGRILNPHVVTVVNQTALENEILSQDKDATTNDYFYHPERDYFCCAHCQYSSKRITDLKKHLKTHTHLEFLSCPHCEYLCKTEDQLTEHMLKHSEEIAEIRPFPCDQCTYRSKTKADLKTHKVTHLKIKPFACTICPYTSARKYRLKNHMKIHSNAKTFFCRLCKYQCESRHILYKHVQRHMKRKIHQCPHCNFQFLTKALLKIHLQEDHPERRPYACDICSFTSWLKSDLKKHEWVHTGISTFECEECDYRCSRINRLREHMLIHKNTKPYKCEKCSYASRNKHYLRKHLEEDHQKKEDQKKSTMIKVTRGFKPKRKRPLRKLGKLSVKPSKSCSPSNLRKTKIDENVVNQDVHFEEDGTLYPENSTDHAEINSSTNLIAGQQVIGQKYYNCPLCSYISPRPSRLKRHMTCHSTERPYKCNHCGVTFKSEASQKQHSKHCSGSYISNKVKVEENDNSYVQSDNDNNLELENTNYISEKTNPESLAAGRTFRGPKSFKCTVCSFVTKTLCQLKRHMPCHTTVRPYKCDQCDMTFKRRDCLRKHSKLHSGVKPHSCKFCKYKCYEKRDLKAHLLIHTDFKPLKCHLCDYTCRKKFRLKEHIMTHSGVKVKPFLCSECGASYCSNNKLKQHILRHRTPKNIQCPHCKFKCRFQNQLVKHMRRHEPGYETGPKPFLCTECGLSFHSKCALRHHMYSHSDEKPWSCQHCSYQSRTKGQLRSHMIKHLETKPFACEYCPFTCKHKSSLERHTQTHTCKEPLQCQFCDFTCIANYNMQRHVRTMHKVETAKSSTHPSRQQIPLENNNCNQSTDSVVYVLGIADNAYNEPADFVNKQMEFGSTQMEFTTGKSMNYNFAAKPVDYTQQNTSFKAGP